MDKTIDARGGRRDWEESATRVSMFATGGDRILIADRNRARTVWLRGIIGKHMRVEHLDGSRSVIDALKLDPPRLLIVGEELTDVRGALLIDFAATHDLLGTTSVIAIADHARDLPVNAHALPRFDRITATLRPELIQAIVSQALQYRAPAERSQPVIAVETVPFREEAIAHARDRGHAGDVVRVHPAWVSGAYWLVLVALVAAGVFATFAQVHQYSEGVAVVRVIGRSDVIALDGGTITSVEVTDGQQVNAGDVLARLHDTEQTTHLHALDAELERRLVAYLQAPGDPTSRQALGQVVTERTAALAGVDARVLRAPHDGWIRDVRVHTGQRVEPGSVAMALARREHEELSVIAVLPGADRPRLGVQQPLRFALPGYRDAHVELAVRAISSDVMSAREAATRYLGTRLGDLGVAGPVVVVEARLATAQFTADGETYLLHDGMVGRAEVQLASSSVLAAVLPETSR